MSNVEYMPCPNCLAIGIKKAETTEIACGICYTSFCSSCSARLSPIIAHGPSYHRPNCIRFEKNIGRTVTMEKSCEECVKFGRLCPSPNNLNKNGDIPENEYY